MLMRSDSPIATMLDMLVEQPFGFTVVARYGMGHQRARQLLIERWRDGPMVLGSECKHINRSGHQGSCEIGGVS